jgi:secreted trypsin-like serine protease
MKNSARVAVTLCLSVAMGCAAIDSEDASESTRRTEERRDAIVGGQVTTGYPAVGTFIIPNGNHRCNGTVIGARTVLTAAHCLLPYDRRPVKFVLGSTYWSPTAVIDVAALKVHPGYVKNQNDIGIVTLASDAPVAPMKILPSMDPSWAGTELSFVGFGYDDGVAKSGKGIKRVVTMPITNVFDTYFDYYVSGKNTCLHDSGGPAFAEVGGELFVAGITSYGDYDCTVYGVDMRPDAYKEFIDANTIGGATSDGGTTTDPCNGETYVGRCEGNTVIWCENSQVQQTDCSAKGKTCNFSTEKQYFACLDDPCHGETFTGRCDGNQLIYCDQQVVHTVTCSNECGMNVQQNYYDCL